MSDTEDEGTFDKEAEREKLRKQLEQEEENRRSTQHMSELLLKGATMTNKHCDDCGDPLFRYEGQEFCPTCAQEGGGQPEGQGAQAAAQDDTDEPASAAQGSAESSAGGSRTQGSAGIDRVETGASPETTGAAGQTGTAESSTSGAGQTAASGSAGQQPTPQSGAGGPGAGKGVAARGDVAGGGAAGAGDVGGNVASARAALARKLAALARQAEATDDVGRSRELLAAAREAAEALAAMDDVGR